MLLKIIIVIKYCVNYGLILKKYVEKEKITQELKSTSIQKLDMQNFLFLESETYSWEKDAYTTLLKVCHEFM